MTTGHGEKLSRNQEKAIAALLSNPSIPEAAAAVGIAEKTLRRWLDDDGFRAAYREACQQVVAAVVQKLQGAMDKALDELVNILAAEETKFFAFQGMVVSERNVIAWGPRLGAAKTILEMGFKAKELADLEARIAALEAAAEGKGR